MSIQERLERALSNRKSAFGDEAYQNELPRSGGSYLPGYDTAELVEGLLKEIVFPTAKEVDMGEHAREANGIPCSYFSAELPEGMIGKKAIITLGEFMDKTIIPEDGKDKIVLDIDLNVSSHQEEELRDMKVPTLELICSAEHITPVDTSTIFVGLGHEKGTEEFTEEPVEMLFFWHPGMPSKAPGGALNVSSVRVNQLGIHKDKNPQYGQIVMVMDRTPYAAHRIKGELLPLHEDISVKLMQHIPG